MTRLYKAIITFPFCILLANISLAQPKMKMLTTSHDFGQVITRNPIKWKFLFVNEGDEPLVISRITTGGGGTMASYPKEPVEPNDTGEIIFYHSGHRIGKWTKCIWIRSNSKTYSASCAINLTGEFIYPPTSISVDKQEQDIGQIKYGEVRIIPYKIINSGKEDLHIHFNWRDYPERDVFRVDIININSDSSESKQTDYWKSAIKPGDTIEVYVYLKNVYGQTGTFRRALKFCYNSHDTIALAITGKYFGEPKTNIVYEGTDILHYENGMLTSMERFTQSGRLTRRHFYRNAKCYKILEYNWRDGTISKQTDF